MRRRDFIKGIAGFATSRPLVARAQQPVMPVVGFLGPGSAESDAYRATAFRQRLNEYGYIEGQN